MKTFLKLLIPVFLIFLLASCNKEDAKEAAAPDDTVESRALSCYTWTTDCANVFRAAKDPSSGLIRLTYDSPGDCDYNYNGGVRRIIYTVQAVGVTTAGCTYYSQSRSLADFLTPTPGTGITKNKDFAYTTFTFDVCRISATTCAGVGGGTWCPAIFPANSSNGYHNVYLYFECGNSGGPAPYASGKSEEDIDVEYQCSIEVQYGDYSTQTWYATLYEEASGCDC